MAADVPGLSLSASHPTLTTSVARPILLIHTTEPTTLSRRPKHVADEVHVPAVQQHDIRRGRIAQNGEPVSCSQCGYKWQLCPEDMARASRARRGRRGLILLLLFAAGAVVVLIGLGIKARADSKQRDRARLRGIEPATEWREVDADFPLKPGQEVCIWFENAWYEGIVLNTRPDGRVEVRYADLGPKYDGVVSRRLLMARGPQSGKGLEKPGPEWRPVGSQEQLQQGQPVLIEWNGHWYAGKVIGAPNPDGVPISYDGYDSGWNETVAPERLRVRASR